MHIQRYLKKYWNLRFDRFLESDSCVSISFKYGRCKCQWLYMNKIFRISFILIFVLQNISFIGKKLWLYKNKINLVYYVNWCLVVPPKIIYLLYLTIFDTNHYFNIQITPFWKHPISFSLNPLFHLTNINYFLRYIYIYKHFSLILYT